MIQYSNKIKTFKISNFRGITSLELNFSEGSFFVIAGENATGKTSAIEAINLCFDERSSKFTEIDESDFNSSGPILFECILDKPFYIVYEDDGYERLIPCKKFQKIIKHRNKKEPNRIFSARYDTKIKFFPEDYVKTETEVRDEEKVLLDSGIRTANQRIMKKFSISGENEITFETISGNEPKSVQVIGFEYMKRIGFPQVFYLGNDRSKEALTGYRTTINNILDELSWRYTKKLPSNEQKVTEKISLLHDSISEIDDTKGSLLTPTINILKGLVNNPKMIESLDLNMITHEDPYRNARLGIKNDSGIFIPIQNLGSGYEIIVALALIVSFARETKIPSILLIDEPELHLESRLQKQLLEYIKSLKEFHTIVTTHSHVFLNTENLCNNLILESSEGKSYVKYCTPLDLYDLQIRLLGNSLSDIFVPEKVLLVEGKFDKNFFLKAIPFLSDKLGNLHIIDVGGKDNIPDKSEKYSEVINSLLEDGHWFSEYLRQNIRIVVDGDVSEDKVDSWVKKYSFDKAKQIKKLDKDCLEYYYPETLVNECISETLLKDESKLSEKSFSEIIKIILDDNDAKEENRIQGENRVSKQRLNDYVIANLESHHLDEACLEEMKQIISWLA